MSTSITDHHTVDNVLFVFCLAIHELIQDIVIALPCLVEFISVSFYVYHVCERCYLSELVSAIEVEHNGIVDDKFT